MLLLAAAAVVRPDEIERLPPWVVAEVPLRPDAPPVRATALLPEEAWAGRAIATLADAFRHIPGAILQESFGGFEPPRISIRGSGLQSAPSSRGVALRLNQLPLGLADGSFNSALIDPRLCNEIAVQRGVDGWDASPAATGGALDFRRSLPPTTTTALHAETGSYGAARAYANSAFVHEPTRAFGAVSLARQDGYRDHSAQDRRALLGTVERSVGAHANATLEVYHAHAHYDVPGGLTLARALTAPREVTDDVRRDQPTRIVELSRVAASFAHADAVTEFEVGAAFGRTVDDFRQLQANGVTHSRSDDVHVRTNLARRFAIGRTPHQFRVTATASRGWREQQRLLNNAGRTGALFAADRLEPTTSVLQAADTFGLAPSVIAMVGVARIDARRAIKDQLEGSATRTISSGATLPAASLRWRFAPENTLFVSVSGAGEPPTFDDLLVVSPSGTSLVRRSQSLALQRATTWEIGARGRAGRLAWDAALYRAAWRNEILRLADARGAARGAVNGGPTTHEGIETSGRWVAYDGPFRLAVVGTATWTRFIFDDDPVYGRNRLAGIPPHFGSAEFIVERPRGGFAAGGADWTAGRTRVDHAGRLAYGGQARLHLRVGWRNPPYWTCFVQIDNLLDRTTISSTAGVLDVARGPAATALFLPGAGRAVTVGIEWRH